MRSDSVKTGTAQAPHRSLFNALGFTEEERRRPMIGIVSSFNEIVPGHMNLDKITEAVKMGVAMAGGMPVVFPAIAVCDGIAMGHVGMKYSLVTRDLIADSTECMAMAHGFDGLVCIPNCDKNVPGLLMAAARVNIPTIFVSGGPMLAGHVHGQKRSLSSMFEAVGSVAAGTMTMDELAEFEEKVCPTCGQQSDSQYDIGYKSRDFAIRREFKTHVTNKTPYQSKQCIRIHVPSSHKKSSSHSFLFAVFFPLFLIMAEKKRMFNYFCQYKLLNNCVFPYNMLL